MMRRVTPVFAVIFAVLLAAPAFAQRNRDRDQDRDQGPRETENVDRTLAMAPGGTVRLKTFSGRVTITGTSGSQVVIKAVRRASRERLNDIKLEITQNGNVVEIDANLVDLVPQLGNETQDVRVPSDAHSKAHRPTVLGSDRALQGVLREPGE